ncbi:ASCH domain-containing protein [Jeotgalibacillus proteolyticus]|uniref:ASCH domain-containing protein n=1 Tax=Jeotgalibacillus proteolyticus TaxID=2082395 RepID=A0A2S5GFT0_9BACL|nr:ASCH domain-containing protein [Jeotgalibacillus proteolyticus]PPA71890.1 hypothetical protein C4B60_00480 [Jeotgalibacillus proteolyticus]
MEHVMGLFEEPFDSMKNGRKKVEVRLFDEKRRKIKIGDTIYFIKVPEQKTSLTRVVTGIKKYATFRELYEEIPASLMDAADRTIDQMMERTYKIYSPKQEKKMGVVAITLKAK